MVCRRLTAQAAHGTRGLSAEGWDLPTASGLLDFACSAFAECQKYLRAGSRHDKGDFVRTAHERLMCASDPFNAKDFFKALRALLRALRPAGKRVLKPYATLQVAGSVSDSHQERIQAQQEHFASLEAGVKCDMRAVLQPASEARFEVAEVPTLSAVEASIRAFRRGKAPGPDMIPDWVWSLQPVQAAHPHY